MLLTLVGSSTRAMVHAAGSCSRRLLVFHTASNEEEKQSAKELKGAEHIEKRPRERERERRESRSIFTLLFRAISSKLDSTSLLLLQIVTTTERLPSVPTVSDTLPASRCQFHFSSSSVGNRVAFSSFACRLFFVALNSSRRSGRGQGIGSGQQVSFFSMGSSDCRLWTVDCFSYLVSTFM